MSNKMQITVFIPSIDAVKNFVTTVCRYNCRVTLRSGIYAVDAKSILGVFSLDVSKPIDAIIEIGENNIDDRDDLLCAIREYIIIT